ncbi:MAG: hypothetical protein EBS06_08700 [Proteobacteria bacterium]|nr:hypothetical protein [Pseudomonadota bacterium]
MKEKYKNPPAKFFSSKTIIVEGREDKEFILNFLRKLKIDDQIYLHEIGGNNLRDESEKSLKLAASSSEFKQNVKHLAIIFDGDGDKSKTFKKVREELCKINLEFEQLEFYLCDKINEINQSLTLKNEKFLEIKTFLFLFEKNLEEAFLKTLSEKDLDIIKNCIPTFFKCANAEEKDKRVVQAFLSTKKSGFDLARDIGVASGQGLVDFEHNYLQNLKKFLLDFTNLN